MPGHLPCKIRPAVRKDRVGAEMDKKKMHFHGQFGKPSRKSVLILNALAGSLSQASMPPMAAALITISGAALSTTALICASSSR